MNTNLVCMSQRLWASTLTWRIWVFINQVLILINNIMTPLQLQITQLIWNWKTIWVPESCWYIFYRKPDAQLHDLHRWMNENTITACWWQWTHHIHYLVELGETKYIPYNSSKELLEQETSTLEQIRDLIINNS